MSIINNLPCGGVEIPSGWGPILAKAQGSTTSYSFLDTNDGNTISVTFGTATTNTQNYGVLFTPLVSFSGKLYKTENYQTKAVTVTFEKGKIYSFYSIKGSSTYSRTTVLYEDGISIVYFNSSTQTYVNEHAKITNITIL